MSSLVIFWIAVAIGFLIIEMITVTFYGLALSFAASLTALYVWYVWLTEITMIQGIIFALSSLLTSIYLPRILTSHTVEHLQWLDTYLGEKRKVKKVWDDYKVVLDGIDYVVAIEWVVIWDRVELTSRRGSVFYGKII